jgi:hypothetical protein
MFCWENIFNGVNTENNLLTAKICIEKALGISKVAFTTQEIKSLFQLSDDRFERDLSYVSGEIRRISIAIGFALGREIFCYPKFNTHEIGDSDFDNVKVLKKHNKLILMPTCRTTLKTPIRRAFDNIIDFHAFDKPYFNIDADELKRMKKHKVWW